MIKLVRTNSENSDFIDLVKQLDAYLKITDGDEHDFYNQFNSIDKLNHTVVAYRENQPVGCGAFKEFDKTSVEVKRMFTSSEAREKGIASLILKELEDWAAELNYSSCVLETGIRQVEAVQFYKKNLYNIIPNYGQYIGVENSLCFEKFLKNEKRQ
ncbi:GNAT family N-acetyltransferase [Winogradskyella echinorum]|uniref:GNAT family N-acetyltransferase n=1 Tax=Winogradskyella echinorum TaxID=538189 RepID=A0ABR6Y3C8_9FLAO|nr:GNAT family N-acetyltransferase [Winogradskyella echinorum]MBC3847251.1 GNAT family N-acetyltransferase [Winogradskyella echinorum]MBC5751599.1 GNAT family N-acetyltransferase [Winogradskyella echinorum]